MADAASLFCVMKVRVGSSDGYQYWLDLRLSEFQSLLDKRFFEVPTTAGTKMWLNRDQIVWFDEAEDWKPEQAS